MDEDGFVALASIANLSHRARVTLEEATRAVETLESPDENSSDPDNEGRRIERVTGGWMVLNAPKYRDLVTRTVSREQTRIRVARHRAKKLGCNADVTLSNGHETVGNGAVTPSEAVTEAEAPPEIPAVWEKFQSRWNELPEPFPKIAKMTASRKVSLKERLRDPFWRDNSETALSSMASSDFLKGKNDRGWIADVDFFLRPDSVAKIIEGKYSPKGSPVKVNGVRKPYEPNI